MSNDDHFFLSRPDYGADYDGNACSFAADTGNFVLLLSLILEWIFLLTN